MGSVLAFDRAAAQSLAAADFGHVSARCPSLPKYRQRPCFMQHSCSSLVSFSLRSNCGLGVGRGGLGVSVDSEFSWVVDSVSESGRELKEGVEDPFLELESESKALGLGLVSF